MAATKLIAVIPAAGRSQRYRDAGGSKGEGAGSKLAEVIQGRTVLAWSVFAFLRRADVAEVVVPTSDRRDAQAMLGDLAADARLTLTSGGDNRAASVRAGLLAAKSPPDVAPWVAVHDAARPAVSESLISAVLAAARSAGAAGPALPVTLTVRQAIGPLPARAGPTLPRDGLFAMQTPQIARRSDLLTALEACPIPLGQVTDDLMALELAGQAAMLVPGEPINLKVTFPEDLELLRRSWKPEPSRPG